MPTEPVAAVLSAPRPARIYRGWWVLAAAFVGEMFAIGSTIYAFGLFVKPLVAEYGLSRAAANSGFMLFILGMGLSAPLIGRVLDRWPTRNVVVAGALAMGAGMAGVALAPSPAVMALCILLLVAPGSVAAGPMTANTLMSRWFLRHRGKAMGIAAVATSLGGALLAPLIGYNLELYGWRTALLIQGGLIAVAVALPAWWLIRDRPQDVGLQPDGAPAPAGGAAAAAAPARAWTVAELLRDRDFWCIGLSVALTFAVSQSLLSSIVPYGTDRGFTLQQATLVVSAMAGCSILGKLVFGALSDRVDQRWLLLTVIAFIVVQLATLVAAPGYWTLLVICGLAGFATGGELPVWAAIVAARFGARSFGTVMGLMNLFNVAASLAAMRFIGQAFDRDGHYGFAFQAFVGVALASGLLALLIRRLPLSTIGSAP